MNRLGRSFAKLKLSGKLSGQGLACAAWPAAIGKRIASHATAIALVRGNLVVECEDGIWQKQLFYLKTHILKKVHEVLGDTTVSDFELRVVAAARRRPPHMASTRVTRPFNAKA